MQFGILFDPLLPLPATAALASVSAALLARNFAAKRSGAALRLLALAALLLGLANPSLKREIREPLEDIIVILEDRSDSMKIGGRDNAAAAAAAELQSRLEGLGGFEIRNAIVPNGDGGTEAFAALSESLAGADRDRLAGAVLVTDGQVHDTPAAGSVSLPLHSLIAGERNQFDRRLIVTEAPAFAVVGDTAVLTGEVKEEGYDPPTASGNMVSVSVNGGETTQIATSGSFEIEVGPIRRGRNIIVLSMPAAEGETTDANNSVAVSVNGVRDQLRVLLVSGFPHAGQRTWRNILKSDDSIDLLHFTILRTDGDQSSARDDELSLIAFPVTELFVNKIDTFDLIILDRYTLKGFVPEGYFLNIGNYVRNGGALLVSAGPEFAGGSSIYRSALSNILPGSPKGDVIETGFRPRLTAMGFRHPVTSGLPGAGETAEQGSSTPEWGRWFRQVGILPKRGQFLMEGASDGGPLLTLDRVGEGRVALLASDQAWLWHRGVEGGGPQLELLRRLAHWLMKEPELEEEALRIQVDGAGCRLTGVSWETMLPQSRLPHQTVRKSLLMAN